MKNRILICILIIFVLVPGFISASQIPISVQKAMELASEQNLSILQMEQKVKSLALETEIRQSSFFPTFQLNGSYSYNSKETSLAFTPFPALVMDSRERYDANVTVSQVLFTGFRLRESYLLTKNRSKEMHWQMQSTKNQIRLGVGSIYYQFQSNRLTREALEQSRARVMNQLLFVKNMLAAKQAIPYDTLEVSNRLLSLDNQISRLKQNEDILILRFNNFINDDEKEYTPSDFDLTIMFEGLEPLSYYLAAAKNSNTEMKQIAMQKESQSNLVNIQKASLYPQLISSIVYHESKPGTNTFSNDWMNYYSVGAGFQWEFWNWKSNYKKVEQVRIEQKRLDLQEKQTLLNLEEQVKETYKYIQISEDQVAMQKKLFNQEKESYIIMQDRYKENQISALDLSSAEKTLTEAQLNLDQQYIALYIYRLQMDVLTGRFVSFEMEGNGHGTTEHRSGL